MAELYLYQAVQGCRAGWVLDRSTVLMPGSPSHHAGRKSFHVLLLNTVHLEAGRLLLWDGTDAE